MPRVERILGIGAPGSGKSNSILSMAALFPNKNFYVIDTEDRVESMLTAGDKSLAKLLGSSRVFTPSAANEEKGKWELLGKGKGNVHCYTALSWPEAEMAWKEIKQQIKAWHDWLVVDRADPCWTWVQDWFITKKYKESLADHIISKNLKMQTKESKHTPRMSDGEWQVINSEYDNLFYSLWYRSRVNVYMTSGIKSVSDEDNIETKDLYGSWGIKPGGQKQLGHQPATTLFFEHKHRLGEWYISTIKDLPGRKYFAKEELNDFAIQYGIGVAGWEA